MTFRHLFILLRILTGIIFILSASVKLFPAEILEVAVAETGLVGWSLAPFVARLLIGFELLLGLMLISGLYLRITIPVSLYTLALFSLYLLILLVTKGNQENCNCFGLTFEMTPFQSIIKNLLLIIALWFSGKRRKEESGKYKPAISIALIIVSLSTPFWVSFIAISKTTPFAETLNRPLNFEYVYNNPDFTPPPVDLRQGKWIIGMVTHSCPYCIVAGYKLSVIYNQLEDMPLFFFIGGSESSVEQYHFKTRSRHIPYSRVGMDDLVQILNYPTVRFPSIFFIEDGQIIYNPSTHSFTDKHIRRWLETE